MALRCTSSQILTWTSDLSLLCLSRSGRLLLPPLSMAAPVSRVTARGRHVMVVTCDGEVSTWDLEAGQARVKRQPAVQLLRGVRLSGVSLTEDGRPVIVVSSGRAYLFCEKMDCWQLITGEMGGWQGVDC